MLFIGPEFDHCLPLSATDSLTDCCLVNLIDVALACKDANSKLVEVVTVANVDAEDHVGNGNEVTKLNLGRDYEARFGQDFDV